MMQKSLDAPTVCHSSLIWENEGFLNQLHNALSIEWILLSNANGCVLLKLEPKGLDCGCWVLAIRKHRTGTLWDLQDHKLIKRDTGALTGSSQLMPVPPEQDGVPTPGCASCWQAWTVRPPQQPGSSHGRHCQ